MHSKLSLYFAAIYPSTQLVTCQSSHLTPSTKLERPKVVLEERNGNNIHRNRTLPVAVVATFAIVVDAFNFYCHYYYF